MGEGALRCSFKLSPNVLPDSPKYSSSHCYLFHLYLYITLLFCVMLSLSLGATRRLLMVLPSLKVGLDAYFTASVLETFTKTLGIRYHHMDVAVVVVATVTVFWPVCCCTLVAFGLKSIEGSGGVLTS